MDEDWNRLTKKRKSDQLEGTGGDHNAGIASSGVSESEKFQDVMVSNEIIICPKCHGNFTSISSYSNHSCMLD